MWSSSSLTSTVWSAVVRSLKNSDWTIVLSVALLGCLVAWLIQHFYSVPNNRSVQPPGPWGLPIVGHLLFLNQKAPYATLANLARRYGSVFRLRLGSISTVVLTDPTLIRQVFRKDIFCGRPPLFVTNGIMEGYGLISAEGERWKEQRRFISKRMHDFGVSKSTMLTTTAILEERIVREISSFHQNLRQFGGDPFVFGSVVFKTMVNLSTSLVFGKTFAEDDPSFQRQLYIAIKGAEMVDLAGFLNFLPFLRFLPYFRRFLRKIWSFKAENDGLLRAIIDERRVIVQEDPDDARNFIDAYLIEMNRRKNDEDVDKSSSHHFTEKQLLQTLNDLFGASLETLKASIEWTFLHLALNPEAQRKCQEEMDAIVGRHRDPTLDDRDLCPFTMATILEAQRLSTVVPLGAPHGSTEDAYLANYFIPKGTMIISLLWAIHNDPNLWPEPKVFRPERFIDEYGTLHVPEHFLPFSAGKRVCVGEELAMMTIFLLVAITLHRFTVGLPENEPQPDVTPLSGFIVAPHPYRMRVTDRSVQP